MATENQKPETEAAVPEEALAEASSAETEEKTEKKTLLTANHIEIIVAIFLGITALLTAWATWIGSLNGGNQATNYTKSNNLAAEGNAAYNTAMQIYLSDMMAWNTAIDYQLDAEVARMKGNEAEAQVYEEKMRAFINQSSSDILKEATNEMTDGMLSPFEIEGMKDRYFTESKKLVAQSQQLLEQGKLDNAHGDAYNLVNVIYSVVLFLLGIVGVFRHLPNRRVVLIVAIIGVIAATVYMCTIPLPTGFSLMNFFRMS